MKGMVEHYLDAFEDALSARAEEKKHRRDGLMEAYLELFVEDHACRKPPPSGLLAAMAEDPDFMAPVRRHHRTFLSSIAEKTGDPATALVVYLAVQGVRSMTLLNVDVLSDDEFATAAQKLLDLVRAGA